MKHASSDATVSSCQACLATTLEARVQRCDHFVMPTLFAHFSPWQDVGTQVSTHGITRGLGILVHGRTANPNLWAATSPDVPSPMCAQRQHMHWAVVRILVHGRTASHLKLSHLGNTKFCWHVPLQLVSVPEGCLNPAQHGCCQVSPRSISARQYTSQRYTR